VLVDGVSGKQRTALVLELAQARPALGDDGAVPARRDDQLFSTRCYHPSTLTEIGCVAPRAAPTLRLVDLTLRPLTTSDIPDLNRLLAESEEVDQTSEHYSEADLEEEFANPDTEIGKDFVGAYEGERLVGHFQVYSRASDGTHHKINLWGTVTPDRRGNGIGTVLVDAMLARVDEVHAERHPDLPVKAMLSAISTNAAQADLLTNAGFDAERYSFAMRMPLGAVDAPPELPEGLELRRYDDTFAEAMLAAHNEAFRDHPNFTPWNDVMWKQWVTESRSFRPELSFVVVEPSDPQRIVAYVQSAEFDAHHAVTGRREAYIGKVGTLRGFRGRGLAGALLRHTLAAAQAAGYDEAALDVDSENPTGALGVYERAGFAVESRWTDFALVRPPVG
jgi:mycothiol synthase